MAYVDLLTDLVATILHIEDDDAMALAFQAAIYEAKLLATVYRASNGEDALAYLRGAGWYAGRTWPDIVFLDLNMPRVDGWEVLKAMRVDNDLRSIPVVILTTVNSVLTVCLSPGDHPIDHMWNHLLREDYRPVDLNVDPITRMSREEMTKLLEERHRIIGQMVLLFAPEDPIIRRLLLHAAEPLAHQNGH